MLASRKSTEKTRKLPSSRSISNQFKSLGVKNTGKSKFNVSKKINENRESSRLRQQSNLQHTTKSKISEENKKKSKRMSKNRTVSEKTPVNDVGNEKTSSKRTASIETDTNSPSTPQGEQRNDAFSGFRNKAKEEKVPLLLPTFKNQQRK